MNLQKSCGSVRMRDEIGVGLTSLFAGWLWFWGDRWQRGTCHRRWRRGSSHWTPCRALRGRGGITPACCLVPAYLYRRLQSCRISAAGCTGSSHSAPCGWSVDKTAGMSRNVICSSKLFWINSIKMTRPGWVFICLTVLTRLCIGHQTVIIRSDTERLTK